MANLEGESVLVFQAGGKRLAVPVGELLGVAPPKITALPLSEDEHLGLMWHHETIFPIFDPLRLHGLGKMRSTPILVLLMECRGCVLGLACQRVEGSGVMEGLPRLVEGGFEGTIAGWPVLRLDLDGVVAARLAEG